MAMSQSELLRLKQEQAIRFISRNKCVDASLMTVINQAKASSVPTPGRVSITSTRDACSGQGTATGKGANGEYIGILQVIFLSNLRGHQKDLVTLLNQGQMQYKRNILLIQVIN
jgi:hypothetical protein